MDVIDIYVQSLCSYTVGETSLLNGYLFKKVEESVSRVVSGSASRQLLYGIVSWSQIGD